MKKGDTVRLEPKTKEFFRFEGDETAVVSHPLQNGGVYVEPALHGIHYWGILDLELVEEENV